MGLTLDIRPSQWSAVKNPVVYQFGTTGGPFVNYRVEVEVFRASDNASLTGGIKFSFSPNAAEITYADISSIVRAYLKAEWVLNTLINQIETDTGLSVYIKYQELYDGSAVGVVDDVANPRNLVFGALQIPSAVGNDLAAYVPSDDTKQFLNIFTVPKMWRGYPFSLSFLYPAADQLYLYASQITAQDATISDARTLLTKPAIDTVHRLDPLKNYPLDPTAKKIGLFLLGEDSLGAELLGNPGFTVSLSPWTGAAFGGSVENWVWDAGTSARLTFPSAGSSNWLAQPGLGDQATGFYVIKLAIANSVAIVQTLVIEAWESGAMVQELINQALPLGLVEANVQTFIVTTTAIFDEIRIRIVNTSGTPQFDLFNASLKKVVFEERTDTILIDVEDPCKNPVLLVWKNSLGGDSYWLFDHEQEINYNFSGSKKAKRMTLFANGLTANDWEGLNELNHLGEVYKQNIPVFTSSIDKSHIRDGFQAYVLDASGNKTGVIVIPTQNVMINKQVKHRFQIEIEFPERYE